MSATLRYIFTILFALGCTMLFPVFISDPTLDFSNSFFSVLMFAGLLILQIHSGKQNDDKRKKRYTRALGLLLSCFYAFGAALKKVGAVPYTSISFMISLFLYGYVFSLLLSELWSLSGKAEKALAAHTCRRASGGFPSICINALLNSPLLGVAVLLACWTPCYLSIFPGNFVFDAAGEYNQLLHGYSGDFPLLHSALLTKILSIIHRLTGSYNIGIAIFVISQMILLAILFWNILHAFHKDGVNRNVLAVMFLYYAVFPVIHLLVTCSTRDVMFSGLIMCAMFMTYQMFRNREQFFSTTRQPIFWGIVLTLTVLSRNNNAGGLGLLAVIFLSTLIWVTIRKTHRKAARILLITPICCYVLLSVVLTAVCQPFAPVQKKGALSLITQPIVRAYYSDGNGWSADEKAEFKEYFDADHLGYVDVNADPTKFNLKENIDTASFLKFWVRMGMKNPGCYLDGILANTRQMWFPDSILDGYVKANMYQPYDKNYFFFAPVIDPPGTFDGKLPRVTEFYRKIALDISFEKIPVVSMLFSVGFMFWMLLNCCAYALYKKATHLYCPLLILLCYTVFSSFVPLVLLRYFAALFFAFPLMVVYTLQPSIQTDVSK